MNSAKKLQFSIIIIVDVLIKCFLNTNNFYRKVDITVVANYLLIAANNNYSCHCLVSY